MIRTMIGVASTIALVPIAAVTMSTAGESAVVVSGVGAVEKSTTAIEKPAGFDTSGYTVIAPVYFGTNGRAESYLRFYNRSGATATFTMRVVGSFYGTDYMNGQTYQLTVPNHASPQYAISELRTAILSATGADITPRSGDEGVFVYVKTDQDGKDVGFQHVQFKSSTGYFENVSLCTYTSSDDLTRLNANLVNVHTSRLGSYPSQIGFINPDNRSRTLRGRVYDARTGASIGSFTQTASANGGKDDYFSDLESVMQFSPSSSQLHVNVEYEVADSLSFTSVVGHGVRQLSSGADFNLTQFCPIRSTSTTTCSSGSTSIPTNPSGQTGGSGSSTSCTQTLLSENYDTLTVGQVLPNWSAGSGGSAPTVQSQYVKSGTRGATISTDTAAKRLFSSTVTSGILDLQIWFKPTIANTSAYGGSYNAGISFVRASDGDPTTLFHKNETNRWYLAGQPVATVSSSAQTVRIRYTVSTGQYEVFLDGTSVGTATNNIGGISGIGIVSGRGGVGDPSYWDDLTVTLDP